MTNSITKTEAYLAADGALCLSKDEAVSRNIALFVLSEETHLASYAYNIADFIVENRQHIQAMLGDLK